jgi:hypothetical protein
MTDYNDGNWHGWNGGDCPVHPKTTIKYEMRNGNVVSADAGGRAWHHTQGGSDIINFRVVKPYTEPREMWAVGKHLFDTPEDAQAFLVALDTDHPGKGYGKQPIIHVREVTE